MWYSNLQKYVPPASWDYISELLSVENIHIRITRPAKTKLGSFSARRHTQYKAININGDLNQWAFLITFLHEFAHLKTWQNHANKVKGHGIEWKNYYRQLIQPLQDKNLLPADISHALHAFFNGKKTNDSTDHALVKILQKYNPHISGKIYVEEIPVGVTFTYGNNQKFVMVEKLRTRFKCKEIKTGKIFIFSPLAEVFPDDFNPQITNDSNKQAGMSSLNNYNPQLYGLTYVKEIPIGGIFMYGNDQKYIIIEKLRTRFKCKEINTGKYYVFSPMAEVKPDDRF